MRLLVTGGAGFIGSNLLSRLQELKTHRAVVLDNETTGRRSYIKDLDHEFVEGDIRDAALMRGLLSSTDAVIHLAADTEVMSSIADPASNMNVNVLGSLNILEAMRETGVRSLVNASTGGAIIGAAEPPVHEDMPPSPLSPYGASKLAVEGYCSAYGACYGMNCVSLRFSNVYGPRSFHKGSVIAHFMKQILKSAPLEVFGDGEQTRDFVHSRDLSNGILAALESGAAGAIQLGSGRPTSINALIELLRSVTGERLQVVYRDARAGEVRNTYCTIDRAKDMIGYRPATDLLDGLRETWSWFRSNSDRFVN